MTTKLDRLNLLLQKEKLDIPDFRRKVGANGSNIKWLRRAVATKPNASPELVQLLGKEIPQLLREV